MAEITIESAPDPMTAAEVATILRIGKSTVFDLCKAGHIRHLRIGKSQRARILIYKEDLRSWVDSSKAGGL